MKDWIIAVLLVCPAFTGEDRLSQRAGKYEVTLRMPAGELYAGEEMQIEFRIQDATQTDSLMGSLPIVRAQIDTRIDMTDMPGMPPQIETAHAEGVPGDYGIHPTFAHGGTHRLRMKIAPPAAEPFDVEFALSVSDARPPNGKRPPPRFRLESLSKPNRSKAGEARTLRLVVRERDNPRGIHTRFEVVHEKLMHLIIVSKDLTYFRHEHPEQPVAGEFVLTHTFPRAGVYHLFADIAPEGTGTQVLFTTMTIAGKKQSEVSPPSGDFGLEARVGETSVAIRPTERPMPARKTLQVPVVFQSVTDGRPVTDLEPYLGAKAHLILIHDDAVTFVHSHPDERNAGEATPGTVPFLIRLPKPGVYRAWLQFIRGGVLQTATLRVEGE
jgi:hypothetical protein